MKVRYSQITLYKPFFLGDKVIVCERGDLVFVFNFHPTQSFTDYKIGCHLSDSLKIVLSSDEPVFGGYNNVSKDYNTEFTPLQENHDNRPFSFFVYAPSRSVVVYAPAKSADPRADSKPTGVSGLGILDRGPYFQP